MSTRRSLWPWIIGAILFAAASAFLIKYGQTRRAVHPGSTVRLHFSAAADGKPVDTTHGREPMTVVQGAGDLVPGLDEALLGLRPGEKKTVQVPALSGYGLRDPDAVRSVPLARFGEQAQHLKPGGKVHGMQGGRLESAAVVAVGSASATLDFNHPYAGKDLTFEVEILAIER
ncbi:MAG: peptidylprolyl isomerase [Elusimicrobiota bacterium]